jgi:hypothetical protein
MQLITKFVFHGKTPKLILTTWVFVIQKLQHGWEPMLIKMHGGNVDLLLQNIVCVVSVLVPSENAHK